MQELFIIVSPSNAAYTGDGREWPPVYFTSREAAKKRIREITPEMPSKDLPLRIMPAETNAEKRAQRQDRNTIKELDEWRRSFGNRR